jgi:hypothetical protein
MRWEDPIGNDVFLDPENAFYYHEDEGSVGRAYGVLSGRDWGEIRAGHWGQWIGLMR